MKIKHYNVVYCLILLLSFQTSCSDIKKNTNRLESNENNVKQTNNIDASEASDTKTISKDNSLSRLRISKDIENNHKRLELIKETIDKYGFLELPYKYYYNSDSMGGISDKINKDLFNSVGIGFSNFIGVLPDTTNNYYILTGMALSVHYLFVSCVNKQGEYLYYKGNVLFDCNCLHMVEQDIYCDEYIIIKDGLELDYYYKTKYVLNLIDGQNDTVCEFKIGKGYINTEDFGKIIYDTIIEKNCLEVE